ncbi:hypothetical protein HYC85_008388 [Camellia sinensis]|uniref:Uncharacterized protein n=1 Tax=Camellia sinensis TaxID=4442 RepID=A0A7J7HRP5_CAMSI|nr:hypothetical protein HYC85_008388 [Camellia sinensis]
MENPSKFQENQNPLEKKINSKREREDGGGPDRSLNVEGERDREEQVLQQKRDNCVQDLIEEHQRIRSESECSDEQRSKTMIDVLLSLQDNELEYYKDELIRGMMQVMRVQMQSKKKSKWFDRPSGEVDHSVSLHVL